jgi:hypothetical protein
VPDIPGLAETPYITSDEAHCLSEQAVITSFWQIEEYNLWN